MLAIPTLCLLLTCGAPQGSPDREVELVLEIPEHDLYPESIAWDPVSKSWLLGSLSHSRILRIYSVPLGRTPRARWTFDEGGGPLGVHGAALELAGRHAHERDLSRIAPGLERLTFSAWTRPRELGGYREIFRQECPRRLLFSFQHDGTILSLGLDVGGYVECDAATDPARLLDGEWHHAAATFDGRHMRVYLDGEEIGSLLRPGELATQGDVAGFIGSLGGVAEHYQGELDDLRVYGEALAPTGIARLHEAGRRALEASRAELRARTDAFWVPGETFARTLHLSRARRIAEGIPAHRDLAGEARRRLREAFPEVERRFFEWTGLDAGRVLAAEDAHGLAGAAGRLVELLLEYAPLTPEQEALLSGEERAAWQAALAIERRRDRLLARQDPEAAVEDWIGLILEAGARVVFRPLAAEAVAPYVPPSTPPLRRRTPEEERELLRADWLHQAGGEPDGPRILREIGWTRQLAGRLAAAAPEGPGLEEELAALDRLEEEARAAADPGRELYFAVRELKRSIALSNPALDFERILLVDGPYPQGSEWRHETRHRLGYMAVPGGRLLVLDGLSPGGRLTLLHPRPPWHGSFWRPDLSFDGRKVLFCFRPHNEKSFHLFEIGIDGEGLVQLTHGPYDDLDPIYLPDGEHVLFSTTRAHTYVRCMPPTNAFVLARCDADGSDIYLISRNNEPDYLPSLLHDGRVVYTRWEYTDKPLWRAQGLWTVHPDGTQVNTLWGNQSVWPDLLKDARAIPGSRRVMFTGSAHHDWFAGSVGIVDPAAGSNFPRGLTKVTAELPWPESGDGPTDPVESPDYHASGRYRGYTSPYPLSETDFLVSAEREGRFVLYLMDVFGNRELVFEGQHNVFHAVPVRARPRPPVRPDRVAWPERASRDEPADGVLFSADVHQGVPEELRGRARYLRVLTIDPKTYTYWHRRPYISTGPVVSMVQSEGVKRILGTVPIEKDGSVAFRVPSGKALHFQLLDEDRRALQTMRSFTGVMPGESRGCLGCHEQHSSASAVSGDRSALVREPSVITPPPWAPDTVGYHRYVQPVLERYCVSCHGGEGGERAEPDLTVRPGYLMFDEPYVTLTGRPSWGAAYQAPPDPPPGFGIAGMLMVEGYATTDPAGYVTPDPMTRLSYASRLIELASSGEHHGVVVDPLSRLRLIAWVDAMCPYRGEEEVRRIEDPDFPGMDWLAIRPLIRTAPTVVRPGPVD